MATGLHAGPGLTVNGLAQAGVALLTMPGALWLPPRQFTRDGTAGPDSICLAIPAQTRGENFRTVAEFTVGAGEQVPFVRSWHPQFAEGSGGGDAVQAIAATEAWWRDWAGRCAYQGPWRDAVVAWPGKSLRDLPCATASRHE